MLDIMMTMYFMKSLTHILWIVIDGHVLKKVKLCQFLSIESWGYLYPKNVAVCLEPCDVIMILSVKPWSIEFSQSCDSGKSSNLSNLSSSVISVISILSNICNLNIQSQSQ